MSLPVRCIAHADRAYDSNRIRDLNEKQGAANIPPKSNRRWRSCFSKTLYKVATQSSACSAASRTVVASPPAMTNSPPTSGATSTPPPPSCGGYEWWA